jgi:DNA polymerase III subunit gamma/tau
MLKKEAFNALLKILEDPPASLKFFLATTEPHKIPTTIISRCQRFNLRRLSKEEISTKLQRIVQEMNVKADATALLRLAGYADGGLRDAESLLDQVITFSDGYVSDAAIETVLGFAPFEWFSELDQAIETANSEIAYRISDRVFHDGKDIGHFLTDLQDHYRTLLLFKLGISTPECSVDAQREALLQKTASSFSQEHLIEIINLFADVAKTLTTATSHRFLLEWVLLNLVRIKRRIPLPLIARKLIELQEKLGPTPQAVVEPPNLTAIQPSKIVTPNKCTTTPPTSTAPTKERSKEVCSKTNPQAKSIEETAAEPQPKKQPPRKSAPVEELPAEQEAIRQENVLQFAAVELGATLIRNNQ